MGSDSDHDHFDVAALFLDLQCFFDGDGIEGVDDEGEMCGVDVVSVRVDPDDRVGIGDALGGNEYPETHTVDPSGSGS